ncbi:YetF domain-containing protein [Filibacter tadaridae]|uniref:YetF C-terminal domain-containing protein n=1 Tax=Filibacter tadaridae TaxID=2483811 RepID=A0A3P5WYI0_9BACL|nr:YetF domain-containing protein [Filibacter tadaridae]VDC23376.1 hypothetical protein FILTAD_00881 [Filibacter tadaridae]
MDLNLIWQTALIFLVGTFYLRISGRKSIAQMTMPQTIIMIALGTLLIQPVTGHGLWTTFGLAAILVIALVVTEYFQIKSDKLESIISGKSIPIIQEGKIIEANLKKLRLTVDKLETRLRQVGITSINDVQTATMEVSGLLGYTLKPEKQPATKEDIEKLIQMIQQKKPVPSLTSSQTKGDIFKEVINEGSSSPPPEHLQ